MSPVRVAACLIVACALAWGQPVVTEGGVLNGASFARGQAVSPGSLVSIFGSDLANGLAQADSIPLSTQIGGTRVLFNDIPSPLFFVDAGQTNAQVPWGLLGGGGASPAATIGAAEVVVERDGVRSAPMMVDIADVAPGIFALLVQGGVVVGNGVGQAIAINNSDGSLAGPESSITGLATKPAETGEVYQIWCTGLGATNPPGVTGADSLDQLRLTVETPEVLIGGVSVQVFGAALTPQFPGVYQVNIGIDENTPTGDNLPVQIRMGDVISTDQVVMSVR